MWKVKCLKELTSEELLEILRLRIDTFVVEQTRIYHEVDDYDKIAYHVFYQTEKGVEAYARVFKLEDHVTFGRVVIQETLRSTGHGKVLMTHILETCQTYFKGQDIVIESQEQVVSFYKKFGFEIIGDTFIFEGTPHVEMKLEKAVL
jgi:ElaA protein